MRIALWFGFCLGCDDFLVPDPGQPFDTDISVADSEILDDSDQECSEEGEQCYFSRDEPAPNGNCCNSRHSCYADGCHY